LVEQVSLFYVKMLVASFLCLICCCIDQTVPDEPFSVNS
jgi:hypothetical protein